jgi:hypothetical protein
MHAINHRASDGHLPCGGVEVELPERRLPNAEQSRESEWNVESVLPRLPNLL